MRPGKSVLSFALAATALLAGQLASPVYGAPLQYNVTAVAADPELFGDVSMLPPIYVGVTAGQTLAGSLIYDPTASLFSLQSYPSDFKVATYSTGYWSLNLPTGQVGGPSAFLGSQVITRNQADLIPDFYDIPIQLNALSSTLADLTFQFPSETTGLALPTTLSLASVDDAFIHIVESDYKNIPIFPGFTGGTITMDFEITSLSPAVPELSTWAMVILGFFSLGLTTHLRRNHALSAT